MIQGTSRNAIGTPRRSTSCKQQIIGQIIGYWEPSSKHRWEHMRYDTLDAQGRCVHASGINPDSLLVLQQRYKPRAHLTISLHMIRVTMLRLQMVVVLVVPLLTCTSNDGKRSGFIDTPTRGLGLCEDSGQSSVISCSVLAALSLFGLCRSLDFKGCLSRSDSAGQRTSIQVFLIFHCMAKANSDTPVAGM